VGRLAEVGVAPQGDLAKAGAAAEFDGLVEVGGGALVTGATGGAVEEEEGFLGVGQGDARETSRGW
jgi:hypothetical protein